MTSTSNHRWLTKQRAILFLWNLARRTAGIRARLYTCRVIVVANRVHCRSYLLISLRASKRLAFEWHTCGNSRWRWSLSSGYFSFEVRFARYFTTVSSRRLIERNCGRWNGIILVYPRAAVLSSKERRVGGCRRANGSARRWKERETDTGNP